jgi:thiol:disulfide interchange protein/DsbC/DsbD-like thiol-disulfide interchange protein
MGRVRFIIGLILLCWLGVPARADSSSADRPHVHVALVVVPQALNRGEAAEAGLYFKIDPGWHVYWKNPGDAGEPPHINWTLPEGVTAGPLQYPAPKRLPLGPLMDYGYEDEVLFPFALNVAQTAKPGQAVLHAKVDWLVCSSSCIPGKAELEISRNLLDHPGKPVSLASDWALFERFIGRVPKPPPARVKVAFQPTKEGFRLSVDTGKRENEASFFPADQDVVDNPAPQKFTASAQGFTLDLKKDGNLTANPAQLRGVVELSGRRAYEIVALPGAGAAGAIATTPGSPAPSAAATPGTAVAQQGAATSSNTAAGTPFATVPVTSAAPTATSTTPSAVSEVVSSAPSAASSVASTSGSSAQKKTGLLEALGLAFVGGLLLNLMPCVFPVLFLKGLSLVHTGHKELHRLRTHGLVYAAGILASFWVLVGTLLALKAAGSTIGWGFQFQSPVVLMLMAGLLFFLGLSLAGQFEIGLTLTSAGGSLAAKQGYAGSFFTGVLAVVVATPCTAPLMGAAIGYALSQSAVVSFAVFTTLALGLAAPYVALTLHPAWARLLPKPGAWMDVLKQAVAVPIFGTVIWLAWVLAEAYGAGLLAILLASFLLLAIAGWFLGRWPLKRWASAVAGLVLVGVVGLGFFGERLASATETATSSAGRPGGGNAGTASADGWEPWSSDAVSGYLAEGRPVFVDFTAKWCLSCQVNERVALTKPEVMEAFREHGVVLLKADWTRHDEAITHALEGLGRSGVPTYVLYTPGQADPELLPEVLTPGIVTDALAKLPKAATQEDASASNRE